MRAELMATERLLRISVHLLIWSVQTRSSKFRALLLKLVISALGGGSFSTVGSLTAESSRISMTRLALTPGATPTATVIWRCRREKVQLVTGLEIRLPLGTIISGPA